MKRFKKADPMGEKRDLIKHFLSDPELRRQFAINTVIRMKAREGIEVDYKQAEKIFDLILEDSHPEMNTRKEK